jgi:DNA polymerase I-like protein with 3'-5' exonuclease and polymerase domains
MEETLIVVENLEELSRVKEYLLTEDFRFVAFDTETTGIEKDSEIVGYSISCEEGIGIYVVLAYWQTFMIKVDCEKCNGTGLGKPTKKEPNKKCKVCEGACTLDKVSGELIYNSELKEASYEIMEILKTKDLIMHNSPFDCARVEYEFKINLMPALHTDTMELAHVLNENERCGLKDIGVREFGASAATEQEEMKASVEANGGVYSGVSKEMYKADKELLARYGAKDTILTLAIFWLYAPRLIEQNLDQFFYEDESMPLMRGATYQLNTVGLKVDVAQIRQVEKDLNDECARLEVEILEAIAPHIQDYPGAKANEKFNIGASQQVSWLLFVKLGNVFATLTDGGKKLAQELTGRTPYTNKAKREFIDAMLAVGKEPHKVMQCDKDVLADFKDKYPWVGKLLEYKKAQTILNTYAIGIQSRIRYGIVYPSFLQHGTTSGRYSSSNPNFQNLPRDDKRIKACIVSRPGKVFVGADYSQLEPRVFASTSQDLTLMSCFAKGEDFYSVVGIPIFNKEGCSAYKKAANAFAELHPELRQISKAFALAAPYGTSAFQQAQKLKLPQKQCEEIIDKYFAAYPNVEQMMLTSHEQAKNNGVVHSLYGRPRRIPEALKIRQIYGDLPHKELPSQARTLLNLAMNHRVQSTGASIVNRAMIKFNRRMIELGLNATAYIVMQIHDEIVVECNAEDADTVVFELKDAMENTCILPGVALIAEPKVATNLADLK